MRYLTVPFMKIATADRVFLIDLVALGSFSCPTLLTSAISFFQKIFGNQDLIKIGWDFNKNDAKKLLSSGSRDNESGQGLFLELFLEHDFHYTGRVLKRRFQKLLLNFIIGSIVSPSP